MRLTAFHNQSYRRVRDVWEAGHGIVSREGEQVTGRRGQISEERRGGKRRGRAADWSEENRKVEIVTERKQVQGRDGGRENRKRDRL